MGFDYDLVCLSRQRWGFAYQRAEPLLRRFAGERRVFFVEAPAEVEGPPRLDRTACEGNLFVYTPKLPAGTGEAEATRLQTAMVRELARRQGVRRHVGWYDAPAALALAGALQPLVTVYDRAGEAAPAPRERELVGRADLVFADGPSPYDAEPALGSKVHAFPNAPEVEYFGRARQRQADPSDQRPLPRPRLGFVGPVDRRLDFALLEGVARARPGWQLMLLGPVADADRRALPRLPNLHYLGPRARAEVPRYLAGWSAALLPFAEALPTRPACPSAALDGLAAGLPVVATRPDLVPAGLGELVRVAGGVPAFVAACEAALADAGRAAWSLEADAALAHHSWDRTQAAMARLVDEAVAARSRLVAPLAALANAAE